MNSIIRLFIFLIVFFCAAAHAKPPNIIYVLVDDLDKLTTDSLAPLGDGTKTYLEIAMPLTTQKLRRHKNNFEFQNAFSGVICCNARASILTGLYPHNTGVFANSGDYGGYKAFRNPFDVLTATQPTVTGARLQRVDGKYIDNDQRGFQVKLKEMGYMTSFLGKYMNGYVQGYFDDFPGMSKAPPGFDDFHAMWSGEMYYGLKYSMIDKLGNVTNYDVNLESESPNYDHYATRQLQYRAESFIEKAKSQSKPLFIFFSAIAPHQPMIADPGFDKDLVKSWMADPKFNHPIRQNYFRDSQSGDRVAGFWDKPTWLTENIEKRLSFKECSKLRWYDWLGSMVAVDRAMDKMLLALGDAELSNSVIIFTSDNGFNRGAHTLLAKSAPYEESIRVPLYVWIGDQARSSLGVVMTHDRVLVKETSLHLDLAPTLLDIAGYKGFRGDGRSLLPILKQAALGPSGSMPEWREDFMSEYFTARKLVNSKTIYTDQANMLLDDGIGDLIESSCPSTEQLTKWDVLSHALLRSRFRANGQIVEFSYVKYFDTYQTIPHQTPSFVELYYLNKDPYQFNNLDKIAEAKVACRELTQIFDERLEAYRKCRDGNCFKPNGFVYKGNASVGTAVEKCIAKAP